MWLASLRTWVRILAGVFLVLFVLWLGTIALILLAGRSPKVQKADAILVLGAAQYNGRPSPVFRARLDHAIQLYRQDYAPYLIMTGGVGVGDTLSEGEVGRRYALQSGVTPDAILVERAGVTSYESIEAAAALMRQHNLHSALLVSDPYHMLRLQLLARRAGIKPLRAPRPGGSLDGTPRYRWRYVLRESVLFPATAFLGAWR